jgi:hypothetical protein
MSDTLVIDRVRANLARLKLRRIGDILEMAMRASEEKSSLALFDELLEEEVACREHIGASLCQGH